MQKFGCKSRVRYSRERTFQNLSFDRCSPRWRQHLREPSMQDLELGNQVLEGRLFEHLYCLDVDFHLAANIWRTSMTYPHVLHAWKKRLSSICSLRTHQTLLFETTNFVFDIFTIEHQIRAHWWLFKNVSILKSTTIYWFLTSWLCNVILDYAIWKFKRFIFLHFLITAIELAWHFGMHGQNSPSCGTLYYSNVFVGTAENGPFRFAPLAALPLTASAQTVTMELNYI